MPSENVAVPSAYDLTAFVGRKKNAERVFFVRSFELNLFTAYVVGFSALASLPVAAVLCIIIALLSPPLAFIGAAAVPIGIMLGLGLIDRRSRRGLQLRKYRALLDRKTARAQQETFYMAGEPVVDSHMAHYTPLFVAVAPEAKVATGTSVRTTSDGEVDLFA